jgi:hypothetical protein
MDNGKEYIVAAAYKLNGAGTIAHKRLIYKHKSLWVDNVPSFDDIYDIRIGRHHAEILHIFGKEVDHHTDGFYTSYGRWVDRKEAAEIAIACGQIKECKYWDNALDSSDIFH